MNNNYIKFKNATLEEKSSIGLKINENEFIFTFPYNYTNTQKNFNELKNDAFKILKAISKYGLNELNGINSQDNYVPLYAMLWLLNNYIENGLYKELERTFAKDNSGKIDWNKTIKSNNVIIENNTIFFKNYVVGRVVLSSNNNFEQIQKYCISVSQRILGWYYNLKPIYYENLSTEELQDYVHFLNKILQETFLDYKKNLITNMLAVLNFCVNNSETYYRYEIFTNYFETVFESLIFKKLSNITKDSLKLFYPNSIWNLENNIKIGSKLRPDAILMLNNNDNTFDVIILDAKYYSYGYNQNSGTIPETSDIVKQIAYATFIKSKFENKNKAPIKLRNGETLNNSLNNIYNFFIIPTCDEDNFKYYGYNELSFTYSNSSYEKVHLIGVNLYNFINDKFDFNKYVKFIQNIINKKS